MMSILTNKGILMSWECVFILDRGGRKAREETLREVGREFRGEGGF